MSDAPKEIIEVRRDDDGELDEIVAENCSVHLEQLAGNSWWLAIEKNGHRQVVFLTTDPEAHPASRALIRANSYDDP